MRLAQALLGFTRSIESENRFFAPAGDARISLVDVRDIAAVAAAALTKAGHEGATYNITGPEALTHQEMAMQFSEALDKRVDYVEVPDAPMHDALLSYGMPAWQAEGLIEDYGHYRRGEASGVSHDVQGVTGIASRSFRTFLNDYRHAFQR